jgi:hypothetical protein
VKNQRVRRPRPPLGRQCAAQLLLDDDRIVRLGDADPVGHAKHVPIDGQARHAQRVAEDDVRRLAADASAMSASMLAYTCSLCRSTSAPAMP